MTTISLYKKLKAPDWNQKKNTTKEESNTAKALNGGEKYIPTKSKVFSSLRGSIATEQSTTIESTSQ